MVEKEGMVPRDDESCEVTARSGRRDADAQVSEADVYHRPDGPEGGGSD